jgi:hypothetical protein
MTHSYLKYPFIIQPDSSGHGSPARIYVLSTYSLLKSVVGDSSGNSTSMYVVISGSNDMVKYFAVRALKGGKNPPSQALGGREGK